MKATITAKHTFHTIPSASGVEVIGDFVFIIGDDSAVLYILNKQIELVDRLHLFSPAVSVEGRIPKPDKPDFECMTSLNIFEEKLLLIAGSGSLSPQRDTGYIISVLPPYKHTAVSLAGIYNQLRAMPEVVSSGTLNIEGIAASEDRLFLLQRGNIWGMNVVISYDLYAFYNYVTGHSEYLPVPALYTYILPVLSGRQSGFSGATLIPGTHALLITASVEDTDNEIDDGAILGSYIGIIYPGSTTLVCVPIIENGEMFMGKVESIAVQQVFSASHLQAIAVTDNDSGSSEVLVMDIEY